MSISKTINDDYSNYLNSENPVLLNILSELESSGILDYMTIARESENGIKTFKNLAGEENSASPLEIMIDCISRGLMKGYQDGFIQGTSIIPSDGASNIGYSNLTALPSVDIALTTNTHEAITLLANEIQAIKSGLVGLGLVLPNVPVVLSQKSSVK